MYAGIDIIPGISLCDIIIVKIKEECVCVVCVYMCLLFICHCFQSPSLAIHCMLTTILQNKIMSTIRRVCFMQ